MLRTAILCFVTLATIGGVVPAKAQSLREALDAAWQRLPVVQTRAARSALMEARRDAANAFSPAPPSIGLEQWNDLPTGNRGFRKFAGEFAWQLWLPGQSRRLLAALAAEVDSLEESTRAARWRIAGEVREAMWQLLLAQSDEQLAARRSAEAAILIADVQRRLQAGTVAPIDLQQARAAESLARGALAEARARVARARGPVRTLTGFDQIEAAAEAIVAAPPKLDEHPLLLALGKTVEAAQAQLVATAGVRRENPEFGVGVFRERGNAAQPFENVVTLRMRIPLESEARNRPRIAEANVALIEAQALLRQERLRVAGEIEAAERELAQFEPAVEFARDRLAQTSTAQALAARAFALGEYDLPARLRIENERFDAALMLARTEIELARLRSRLHQAYGLLP